MRAFTACEDCVYWSEFPHSPEDNHRRRLGTCRFMPPVVLDSVHKGKWPVTEHDAWCGRFEKEGKESK